MRKHVFLMFSLLALSVAVLSACSGVINVVPSAAAPETGLSESGQAAENQQDQTQPVVPTSAKGENQTEPAAQVGETAGEGNDSALLARPELGFTPGGSQLIASNPNQVNLASGDLQLVELFAFW